MKEPKLCLHCGANEVPRKAISAVVLPEATKTYQPMAHDFFLEEIQNQLADFGFNFGAEAHALSHEGARYFGMVNLVNGADSEEHALILGVRNSLDKKFAAGISIGSHVFVCDNLAFTGDNVIKHKHTPNILKKMPSLIGKAVADTAAFRDAQNARFEAYRNSRLGDVMAHNLIIECLRRGAVNTTRVQRMVAEWHEPSFEHGDKSVWRLFNAGTESLKGVNLYDIPGRTIEMQRVMDESIGFKYEMAA